MSNFTAISGFLLMGFSNIQNLQTLCGVFFLVMYMAALISNLIIITLTTLDLQLQTPMYFFLKNLSLLDVFFVSVPIPNFIVNSLTHHNSISIFACALQVFLMTSFAAGELFVLTSMSYDRYVAICCPLHYDAIMNSSTCMLMVGVSWITGVFFGAMYTSGTFSMPFCGSNMIPQFFCDVPSLLRISCSKMFLFIYTSLGIGVCLGMSCFICVVISYVYIFSSVLKIPTTKGQSKAFATCIPHLTVFTVFIATACFVYVKPSSNVPSISDRLFSVLYTVLPPALNPVIYSLRNNDVKCAMRRLQQNLFSRGSLHLTLQSICQWFSSSQDTSKMCNF
ncbi:olfactory receptor 14A2-like [Mesocricetus auratus]|uniref:Olfactory receptor n=1 Tax=Mesocricetus auratus TaxID=10036 RepID=A0ABM2W3I1_MESAU|nr:olfactory receptor 14A2-like [Mesocricetus auratus]XP_040584878.1 olfactory receptor 14A2-like [Mesocricetus auratus]XP_040584888.1 olfactory receptor 14A2-like [Mesocricetus auratus]